jgi:hypothetical protein
MENPVMGVLLDKIQKQTVADSVDLRKISRGAASGVRNHCGKLRKTEGLSRSNRPNPQNPQSLRTLKPAPDIAFHKSANPQGIQTENNSNQSRLIRLAIQSGVFDQGLKLDEREIAALVPPTDWRDVAGCNLDELKAWAAALAMRAVRYRGKVPRGWDMVSTCAHCGPVWSDHGLDTLSCGWCDMRMAGKWFPAP